MSSKPATEVAAGKEVEGGLRVGLEGEAGAGCGPAGLVVEEAEELSAEGAGAAAVAVGEDVAALEDGCFGGDGFDRHVCGDPPSPRKYLKYSEQAC